MGKKVKLKACPFCGAPDPEVGGNYIECRTCGGEAMVEEWDGDSQVEAIRRWNSRASLSVEQDEVNKALEGAAKALDKAAATIRGRISNG